MSTQSYDNNATEIKCFMLHHSSHKFDIKIRQCCILEHHQHYNGAGTRKFKFSQAQEAKIRKGHAEGSIWHQTSLWAEKGKKLLAALYRQICTAGTVLPFSAGSRTLLFRECRSRFVFLWEKIDPLPFQEKASGKPQEIRPLPLTCPLC